MTPRLGSDSMLTSASTVSIDRQHRPRRSSVKYWLHKLPDRLAMWAAYRLPRRVAYWAAIRVGAKATTGPHGDQVVPELKFMDALERWEKAS